MSRTSQRTCSLVAAFLAVAGFLVCPHVAGAQAQHEQHPPHGHDAGRHMEHRFDDPERYAQSFDDPARDEWQMPQRVIAALEVGAGQVVADIGAGTGYFTERLARDTAARTVYAVDIEPSMVDYVRRRAEAAGLGTSFGVVADPASPTSGSGRPVLSVNTYHHIPDRVAYFAALRNGMPRAGASHHRPPEAGARRGPARRVRIHPGGLGDELGRPGSSC